jgi:hypothetical protein
MRNYLEQFKTEEEVDLEIARINNEFSKAEKGQINIDLCKKKNSLIQYKQYLKEKIILDAMAKIRKNRG